MSILILNRASLNIVKYHEWLSRYPGKIVFFGSKEKSEKFSENPHEILKNFDHVELFENYDHNGNVEIRAIELHNVYRFKKIFTISEADILRAALLRDYLGIDGQTYKSATVFRDKLFMYECAEKGNINVPVSRKVNSSIDIYDFKNHFGFSFVMKPTCGYGSIGVSVIQNDKDLVNTLKQKDANQLLVQEYIDGTLYHIDGIVINGKCVSIWPFLYTATPLEIINGKMSKHFSLSLQNPLASQLNDFVLNILAVFPTPKNTTFHAEVFHHKSGKLILGEIASRTGGERVNEMFEKTMGINLNKAWLEAETGLISKNMKWPKFPKKICGCALILPKKGIFLCEPKEPPPFSFIEDYRIQAKTGQFFETEKPTSSMDHIASFIVSANSEEEVSQRLNQSVEWFWDQVKWKNK